MAQTREGAKKIAAKKIGISLTEYKELINVGKKWCYKCRDWKPRRRFNIDNYRGDGLTAICHDCIHVKNPYASLKGRVSTFKGKRHTEEAKRKMSIARKGRPSGRLGKKHTLETRRKISRKLRKNAVRGKKNHSYKDGKVAQRRGLRFSTAYKRWRYDVYSRDKFTC